ncbi:MAG: hypothetical protein V4657_03995 [Pseudomonadota bacterium]
MSEISSILIRLRELAVQSVNSAAAASDRTALAAEAKALTAQIGDITVRMDFNDTVLIDAANTISIQTGVEVVETVVFALGAKTATGLGINMVDHVDYGRRRCRIELARHYYRYRRNTARQYRYYAKPS